MVDRQFAAVLLRIADIAAAEMGVAGAVGHEDLRPAGERVFRIGKVEHAAFRARLVGVHFGERCVGVEAEGGIAQLAGPAGAAPVEEDHHARGVALADVEGVGRAGGAERIAAGRDGGPGRRGRRFGKLRRGGAGGLAAGQQGRSGGGRERKFKGHGVPPAATCGPAGDEPRRTLAGWQSGLCGDFRDGGFRRFADAEPAGQEADRGALQDEADEDDEEGDVEEVTPARRAAPG
jgi:hypothetical protein